MRNNPGYITFDTFRSDQNKTGSKKVEVRNPRMPVTARILIFFNSLRDPVRLSNFDPPTGILGGVGKPHVFRWSKG